MGVGSLGTGSIMKTTCFLIFVFTKLWIIWVIEYRVVDVPC